MSSAGPSSRSPSLPRSSLHSAHPQSPDLLCHGIQTRTASDSHSQLSSTQRADLGLLSGAPRSSISADIEQLQAASEQQSKQLRPSSAGSSGPTAATAANESSSHSASSAPRTKPPPLPAPVAVYRMRDDDDDDDEDEDEEDEEEEGAGKIDELELITEEQVFAAAHDSFDDDQSLNAAPMNARRMSLLASAPPGSSISSSLSLGYSPLSASM